MLSHHYSAALEYARASGRETGDLEEPARRALVEAGDRALALFAFAAAARFYSDALALWPAGADLPDPALLLRIGKAHHGAGDERAQRVLEDASEANLRAGDRASAAVAEALLLNLRWLRRDAVGARMHRARALELIADEPASPAKALVLSRVASSLHVADESEEALRIGREALAIAEALGLADVVVHALTTIGGARCGLGDPGGVADFERSIQTALAANSPEALRAYNNLAVVHRDNGDVVRARATVQEGIRSAERVGGGPSLLFLKQVKTVDDYFVGEWDEAVRALDRFIAETESAPHYQEGGLRAFRAVIRAARSDLEGARTDVERALTAARTAGDPQAVAPVLGLAAQVFFIAGEAIRARQIGQELLTLLSAVRSEAQFTSLLAPLSASLGLDEELANVFGQPAPGESGWVTAARTRAEGRFLEAAELYAAMPMRPDEAEARLRAAEQLLSQGRRAEADEQLRLAIAFWRSVGATWFIREAEKLLAATA
jgi:tetratricopeptide (TPR) repeat protein